LTNEDSPTRSNGDSKDQEEADAAQRLAANSRSTTTTTMTTMAATVMGTETSLSSIFNHSSRMPPDVISSSPNTRTSSPSHVALESPSPMNGIVKKTNLKAALSLDPSALCRGAMSYEKIAFSPPKPEINKPKSTEIRKVRRPLKLWETWCTKLLSESNELESFFYW
jgi:hypothetical protein